MPSVLARRVLAAALICALGVRLVHLASISKDGTFLLHDVSPQTDNSIFEHWARNIVGGDALGRVPYHPFPPWQLRVASAAQWDRWYGHPRTFIKAPFYPYLIALLKSLFGPSVLPLVLLQISSSLASMVLLYLLGRRLSGETTGLVGATLYGLYAPSVHFDMTMLRGPWIILSGLLVTWQLARFLERPAGRVGFALGACVGLAVAVNEAFGMLFFFVPCVAAWGLRGAGRRRQVALFGWFIAGAGVALAPILLRNALVGAPLLNVASSGGLLAVHNSPGSDPYFFHPHPVARFLEAGDGRFFATFLACLRGFSSFGEWAGLYLQRLVGMFVPFENPDNFNFYFAALRSPVLRWLPDFTWIAPLGLLGGVLALREPKRFRALLPLVVATLIAMGITAPLSRYRATLAPYFCLLAGLFLATALGWLRDGRYRSVALGVLAAGLLALGLGFFQRKVLFHDEPDTAIRYRWHEFWVSAQDRADRGDWDGAVAALREFTDHKPAPDWTNTTLLKAAGYRLQAREPDGARALATEALVSAAGQPELLYQSAEFFRNQLHDVATARGLYQQALAVQPSPKLRARLQQLLGAAH